MSSSDSSLTGATGAGGEPSIVCKSTPPFACVYANREWEALCGFTSHEMLGRDLRCLQGPATDKHAIEQLMASVHKQEPCVVADLINYDKQRRPFCHTVTITPLSSPDGSVGLFRATSRSVSQLTSACRAADSSIDLAAEQAALLDTSHGDQAIDTTAATLAAAVTHKRAREPSKEGLTRGLSFLEHNTHGAPVESVPKYLPLNCRQPPAMVVLTAPCAPYGIVWASPGWCDVCGFHFSEIVGNDLSCIQGPATDRDAIRLLMTHVRQKEKCTLNGLINYDKKRRTHKHATEPLFFILPALPPHARLSPGLFSSSLAFFILQGHSSIR